MNDSGLDLVFERVTEVPRERIWTAWTQPALLEQWFTPAPWRTIDCEIDLRPGGVFRTTMLSPEAVEHSNIGTYLEIRPNERLVWTNALGPGFRPGGDPLDKMGFLFTVILTLAPHEQGTRYAARVLHADEAGCQKHASMGFQEGWGKAFEQLIALVAI